VAVDNGTLGVMNFVVFLAILTLGLWTIRAARRINRLSSAVDQLSVALRDHSDSVIQRLQDQPPPVALRRVYHVLLKIDEKFWTDTVKVSADELAYLKEQRNWDVGGYGTGFPEFRIQLWAGGYSRGQWLPAGQFKPEIFESWPTSPGRYLPLSWGFSQEPDKSSEGFVSLEIREGLRFTLYGHGNRFQVGDQQDDKEMRICYLHLDLRDEEKLSKFQLSHSSDEVIFAGDPRYQEMDSLDHMFAGHDTNAGVYYFIKRDPNIRRYKGNSPDWLRWSIMVEDIEGYAAAEYARRER
jgi:hypothetical protein